MEALGTVIEWDGQSLSGSEFYCGVLDYYDHWNSVDVRLEPHHKRLSPPAFALGHDIVNLASYTSEILRWISPENIRLAPSVVMAGAMTEAFFYSVRSACDAIAATLAYVACEKPGQAPKERLPRLIRWANENMTRIRPEVLAVLSADLAWFWKLRNLRDHIVHQNAGANIHCDGHQFNLWIHSPEVGWVTREPLLPLLADLLERLVAFGNDAAFAVNKVVNLPPDRVRSRVVQGVLISTLHDLISKAPEYARDSL
jgi:hypothetical protein